MQETQSDHEVMHVHLQILNYFVGILRSTRTDCEYLEILVTKVLPIIHIIAPDSIELWEVRQATHLQKREHAEQQTLCELKKAFAQLKKTAEKEKLIENEHIRQRVCIIDNILSKHLKEAAFKIECNTKEIPYGICLYCGAREEQHRPFVFPSYNAGLFDHINSLCHKIFELGGPDLVRGLVEIKTVQQYVPDHAGKYILRKVDRIERPLFAPSLFEVRELDDVFSWLIQENCVIPSWVAWDMLFCVEWARRTSRDFLRKKNLHSDDLKESNRSAHLLQLHSLRADLQAIKDKKQGDKVILHNRKHFEKALDVILKEICHSAGLETLPTENTAFPQELTLHIEDSLDPKKPILLQLKVTWAHDLIETLQLHSFQIKKSNAYDFIKRLIDSNSIDVGMRANHPQCNPSHVLKKVGICDILGQLFIAKKTSKKVTLYGKTISLANKPASVIKKLRKYLQTIESCGWDSEIDITTDKSFATVASLVRNQNSHQNQASCAHAILASHR